MSTAEGRRSRVRLGVSNLLRPALWTVALLALVRGGLSTGQTQDTPVASGAALNALLESFSGHLAVLPAPGLGRLDATPVGRTLCEAGLAPHVTSLAPAQLTDTNFFTARRFPVALYLGGESYFQTVRQTGDGDAALRQYLAGGGTLLVLPSGPMPLFYNQAGQPVSGFAVVGLNLGAGAFENPPPQLKPSFRVATNQDVLRWPPIELPFPGAWEADQRWRPSRAPGGAETRYTPLATLRDDRGGNHGDGAALLEFTNGPLRGGRVLYVWASLLADENRRAAAVPHLLRWAFAGRAPPRATQMHDDFEGRGEPRADGVLWFVRAGEWKLDQGALVGGDCVADGYEIKGAARGSEHWRDYTLSVRFKVDSRGSDWRDGPWFGVRCRPDGDGYYLTFTDRDCQWHKVLYGLSTSDANPLARAAWKADPAWHALRVTVQANRLKAELDGQPLLEAKDDAHLNLPSLRSGGVVLAARRGSRSQGSTVVRFDDFAVQLLDTR